MHACTVHYRVKQIDTSAEITDVKIEVTLIISIIMWLVAHFKILAVSFININSMCYFKKPMKLSRNELLQSNI